MMRFLELVRALPISVEVESPERMLTDIIALAREFQLSTHDASYLDLAMRLGLPIATQDELLKKAAQKSGVVLYAEKQARRKR